jgi:hypothetical protein
METPLIIWCCTVALILLLLLTRLVPHHGKNHKHRTRVFEIGTEREEFFVPGDPLQKYDTTDYNDDF